MTYFRPVKSNINMKRVIVDYNKLTNEILSMLVEKYPEGYTDADVIRFKNAKNETVDALEVRTDDTIYLVKVSTRLADTMENFDEDDDFMNNEEDDMSVSNLDIPDDSSLALIFLIKIFVFSLNSSLIM